MVVKAYDENNVLQAKLDVHGKDIEEAIMRLGWTILNDAEHVTKEDEKVLRALQQKEFVESRFGEGSKEVEKARVWWDEHLVS